MSTPLGIGSNLGSQPQNNPQDNPQNNPQTQPAPHPSPSTIQHVTIPLNILSPDNQTTLLKLLQGQNAPQPQAPRTNSPVSNMGGTIGGGSMGGPMGGNIGGDMGGNMGGDMGEGIRGIMGGGIGGGTMGSQALPKQIGVAIGGNMGGNMGGGIMRAGMVGPIFSQTLSNQNQNHNSLAQFHHIHHNHNLHPIPQFMGPGPQLPQHSQNIGPMPQLPQYGQNMPYQNMGFSMSQNPLPQPIQITMTRPSLAMSQLPHQPQQPHPQNIGGMNTPNNGKCLSPNCTNPNCTNTNFVHAAKALNSLATPVIASSNNSQLAPKDQTQKPTTQTATTAPTNSSTQTTTTTTTTNTTAPTADEKPATTKKDEALQQSQGANSSSSASLTDVRTLDSSYPLMKHIRKLETMLSSKIIGLDQDIKKVASLVLKRRSVRIIGPICSGKTSLVVKFFQEVKAGKFPPFSEKHLVGFDIFSATMDPYFDPSKSTAAFINQIVYIRDFEKYVELTKLTRNYQKNFLPLLKFFQSDKNSCFIIETKDDQPFPLIDEYFDKIPLRLLPEEELSAIIKGRGKGKDLDEPFVKTICSFACRFSPKNPLCFSLEILRRIYADRSINNKPEAPHTVEEVFTAVANKVGIPQEILKKNSPHTLKTVLERLSQKVKWQPFAVQAISKVVRRLETNVNDSSIPAAVLLFVGPTGVGKTELGIALAVELFGSATDHFTRIDMNEYQEKDQVSKFWGSFHEHEVHGIEGTLTRAVQDNPCSVIFLDEIDKAHPDIVKGLLRLFDEGRITSGKGKSIDAKNTVFVMTSKFGEEFCTTTASSARKSPEDIESAIKPKLEQLFTLEGSHTIQQVIPFYAIEKEDILSLIQVQVENFQNEIFSSKGFFIDINDEVVQYLAQKYYSPQYGVGQLKRGLNEIRNKIADYLAEKNSAPNKLTLFMEENSFSVKEG